MKRFAWILVLLLGGVFLASCAPVTPQSVARQGMPERAVTASPGNLPSRPSEKSILTVPEGGMQVKPKTLRQGDQWPTRGSEAFFLITGPTAWGAFLSRQHSDPAQWPSVDWAHEVAFVALMGGRRTGGYRITVKDVTVQDNLVFVRVQEESPSRDEMVIQVLTSPYDVVTVPREVLPKGAFVLRVLTNRGVWEAKITNIQADTIYSAQQTMALPERPGKGEAPTK